MNAPLARLAISVGCLLTVSVVQAIEVDTSFQANVPNGTVHAIALTGEGGLWIGGEFDSVNAQNARFFAKLSSTGALDSNPGISVAGPVFSIARGLAGTPVVAGDFGIASVGWSVQANGRVLSIGVDSQGNLLAGGTFWSQPGTFVTRLRPNGAVDSAFNSALKMNFSLEAGANVLAVQSDGKIVVGGNFDTTAGFTTLARLNTDGSIDTNFSRENGSVLYPKALVLLADGKILLGGTADSSGRGFVRRLKSDGTVDPSFAEVSWDGAVEVLAVDPTGRILAGGSFTEVNSVEHAHLARLNADGSVDASWGLGANNVVKALATGNDGSLFVGGAFSQIGGVAQSGIARLHDSNVVASSAQANLRLKAEAGQNYVIESSTDLVNWSLYRRELAGADGIAVQAATTAAPRLFFRARAAQ